MLSRADISLGIAVAAAKISGRTMTEGLVIGAMISVASTMVTVKVLGGSGRLSTEYGRVMISITLVEDPAVLCMTATLPAFGDSGDYVTKWPGLSGGRCSF